MFRLHTNTPTHWHRHTHTRICWLVVIRLLELRGGFLCWHIVLSRQNVKIVNKEKWPLHFSCHKGCCSLRQLEISIYLICLLWTRMNLSLSFSLFLLLRFSVAFFFLLSFMFLIVGCLILFSFFIIRLFRHFILSPLVRCPQSGRPKCKLVWMWKSYHIWMMKKTAFDFSELNGTERANERTDGRTKHTERNDRFFWPLFISVVFICNPYSIGTHWPAFTSME